MGTELMAGEASGERSARAHTGARTAAASRLGASRAGEIMDGVKSWTGRAPASVEAGKQPRPSRDEAERAVRTLIRYAGEDPRREGLAETPERVVRAFDELFSGYREDPRLVLDRVFEDVDGYGDMVLVRDIPFASHCEHHMVPFLGEAHVAYYPSKGVVGLSKLARVVEIFARRLQTQEAMTV